MVVFFWACSPSSKGDQEVDLEVEVLLKPEQWVLEYWSADNELLRTLHVYRPSISFDENRVIGCSGVNGYMSNYEADDSGRIRIGSIEILGSD